MQNRCYRERAMHRYEVRDAIAGRKFAQAVSRLFFNFILTDLDQCSPQAVEAILRRLLGQFFVEPPTGRNESL